VTQVKDLVNRVARIAVEAVSQPNYWKSQHCTWSPCCANTL